MSDQSQPYNPFAQMAPPPRVIEGAPPPPADPTVQQPTGVPWVDQPEVTPLDTMSPQQFAQAFQQLQAMDPQDQPFVTRPAQAPYPGNPYQQPNAQGAVTNPQPNLASQQNVDANYQQYLASQQGALTQQQQAQAQEAAGIPPVTPTNPYLEGGAYYDPISQAVAAEQQQQQQPTSDPSGTLDIDGQQIPVSTLSQLYQWASGLTQQQWDAVSPQVQQGPTQYAPPPQQFPPSYPPVAPYVPSPPSYAYPPIAAYGQQVAAPPQSLPAGGEQVVGPVSPSFPGPATASALPPPPDLSMLQDVAPGLREYLQSVHQFATTQQQQVFQAQQQAAWLANQQAEAAMRSNQREFDTGVNNFKTQNPAFAQDIDALSDTAARLNILPGLVSSYNGDVARATQDALRIAASMDEKFQGKLVQNALDQFAMQQQQMRDKRDMAASLAAPASAIPRTPAAVDVRNLTPQQREQAMAAEISGQFSRSYN
jgi:hypothetical protein